MYFYFVVETLYFGLGRKNTVFRFFSFHSFIGSKYWMMKHVISILNFYICNEAKIISW